MSFSIEYILFGGMEMGFLSGDDLLIIIGDWFNFGFFIDGIELEYGLLVVCVGVLLYEEVEV